MSTIETGLLARAAGAAGGIPYIRGGAGSSEAVVFAGGNALFKRREKVASAQRYAGQVQRLLPGHRYTVLGYAGSSFAEITRDLAEVIRTPAELIVGVSFGGFVALRFAAEHPELVKRLVLLVSAHRLSQGGWKMLERQFAALERGDIAPIVRDNLLLFRRRRYNWLLRCLLSAERRRVARSLRDPAEILRDYRELFGPELRRNADYARRITCPTLIIGGTADQYFDRAAFEETAAMIPSARLHLFERETHMLPIERSAEVARLLSRESGAMNACA